MSRTLYRSIEEMTDPETLSALVGDSITTPCVAPFAIAGWSSTDSEFLAVDDCGVEPPRFVLKRVRAEQDWVMEATDDHDSRAVAVWRHGLLDRLPDGLAHGIIACTADDAGYAILMHNLAHTLMREEIPLAEKDHLLVLDRLATLHTAFWEDSMLDHPGLSLCTVEVFLSHAAPDKIRRIATKNQSIVLAIILEGWALLPEHVGTDVTNLIHALQSDPTAVSRALSHFPRTLVHGDIRRANLGLERGGQSRLFLLDWTRPMAAAPALDLAYYLSTMLGAHQPVPREQSIEYYKQRLAARLGDRFDESWWQPQLELSMLGVFANMSGIKAYFAAHTQDAERRQQEQDDIDWWAAQMPTWAAQLTGS